MKSYQLVFRDFGRRKNRTMLAILIITMAVALIITVDSLTEGIHESTRQELTRFGANIRVTAAKSGLIENHAGLHIENSTIPEAIVEQIRKAPHSDMIRAVAPRLEARTSIDGIPVILTGVSTDERLLRIWWRFDGGLLQEEHFPSGNKILIGARLFARLGQPQTIEVSGRTFRIIGVLDRTGDQDDDSMILELASLQNAVGMLGAVHKIEIASGCIACKDMDVYDHANEIREHLSGSSQGSLRVEAVRQIAQAQISTLRMVEQAALGLSLIILILAAMFIATDLFSRIHERRREFAIFRAIGMQRWQLGSLVLGRGVSIGMIGALCGAAIGTAGSLILGPTLLTISAPPTVFALILAPLVAVLTTIAASVGPAIKGAKLSLSAILAEE